VRAVEGRAGGRGACGRLRGAQAAAGGVHGGAAGTERAGGRGACWRLWGVRPTARLAAAGRADSGRWEQGWPRGVRAAAERAADCGARGRPREVRAAAARAQAAEAGRASGHPRACGPRAGCPGDSGKHGLERGRSSVRAATECVGGALFRKELFPGMCLMWDELLRNDSTVRQIEL
jgi:hypothetical protein